MPKIYGIHLGKNQTQLTSLEFDNKDFDRSDEQLRFRIIENKDFLSDIHYEYNEFSNDFSAQINQELYNIKLKDNCLISNIVWLYFCQLSSPTDFKEELIRQNLSFSERLLDQNKLPRNLNGSDCISIKKLDQTNHDKSGSNLMGGTPNRRRNESNQFSNKSLDIGEVSQDGVTEFDIYGNDSDASLPEQISDFLINLKSGFCETAKVDKELQKEFRFIGDQGFIIRAEKKYLIGIDRMKDILLDKQQEKHQAIVERDKSLSIRDIFKDYIDKILDYIIPKNNSGK